MRTSSLMVMFDCTNAFARAAHEDSLQEATQWFGNDAVYVQYILR